MITILISGKINNCFCCIAHQKVQECDATEDAIIQKSPAQN